MKQFINNSLFPIIAFATIATSILVLNQNVSISDVIMGLRLIAFIEDPISWLP